MVYLTKFIRITPAGMEIMVRIIGISLLMKIPVAPLERNTGFWTQA